MGSFHFPMQGMWDLGQWSHQRLSNWSKATCSGLYADMIDISMQKGISIIPGPIQALVSRPFEVKSFMQVIITW